MTKKILAAIIIRRLKRKKPVVMFISGDSGEGKSFSALKLQEIILEMMGIKLIDYINDINVYTPMQYPEKLDNLLFKKELKKINILCMHEAREVVKAKNWASFLSQSVADVNAMSRSVKRLFTIVISQFIRDITTDIRYTLTYYCTVERPLHASRSRLRIFKLIKDDSDLEKPTLKKAKIKGWIKYPDGHKRLFIPSYIELSKPSKEITDIFEEQDRNAKALIIRSKLNKLLAQMKIEAGFESRKVEAMVEWYSKHPEQLSIIGKQVRGKYKLNKEVMEMHEIDVNEFKRFQKLLGERLKKTGLIIENIEDQWKDQQPANSDNLDTKKEVLPDAQEQQKERQEVQDAPELDGESVSQEEGQDGK